MPRGVAAPPRTDREIIKALSRRDAVVDRSIYGPTAYEQGAQFLSNGLDAWLSYAKGAAKGALESLAEGLWHKRIEYGTLATVSALADAADSLERAVRKRQWDHAVFHALLLGRHLGALGVLGARNYDAPLVERAYRFKGGPRRGAGPKRKVSPKDFTRAFDELRAEKPRLPPTNRRFRAFLQDKLRVRLSDKTIQRTIKDLKLS